MAWLYISIFCCMIKDLQTRCQAIGNYYGIRYMRDYHFVGEVPHDRLFEPLYYVFKDSSFCHRAFVRVVFIFAERYLTSDLRVFVDFYTGNFNANFLNCILEGLHLKRHQHVDFFDTDFFLKLACVVSYYYSLHILSKEELDLLRSLHNSVFCKELSFL